MAISTLLQLKTAATSNAVSLTEAKAHLRVDSSDDDTYVTSLIVAAQRHVESYTNRCLSDTTYYFKLSAMPKGGIVLPFSPIKSITSVTYYDSDNSVQTLSTDNYYYNVFEEPCTLRWVEDITDTYKYRTDAVIVEFVAGYTTPQVIPPALQHAIKLLLTDMYEMRTDMPREKFTAWKSLAYPYRVWHSTTNNT